MSDDKLREIAERLAEDEEPDGPFLDILAALQPARDLGRRETLAEPASIPGTDAAVKLATTLGYDVAKFPMVTQIMRQHIGDAVDAGREGEREALREIVERILGDRSYAYYRTQILTALDARSSQGMSHAKGCITQTEPTYACDCGSEKP